MTDFKPAVYLAGPVQHVEDGGSTWRDKVKELYGDQFDLLDPLDKYDTSSLEVEWLQPDETPSDYPDADEVLSPMEIVGPDKDMIDASDVVLIGLRDTVPMYGTPREHEYAHQTDTEVVMWYKEEMRLSPWAIANTGFMDTELHPCMEYILESYVRHAVGDTVVNTLREALE